MMTGKAVVREPKISQNEADPVNPDADVPAKTIDRAGKADASQPRQQFGVLPYRLTAEGTIEVLLVTSLNTRRWIIPKGWPMGTLAPHKVAAREAFEEAGILGKVSKAPLGRYGYDKVTAKGRVMRCEVAVFALAVERQKSVWPERKLREWRWLDQNAAADLVSDVELAPIIRAFAPARA